MRGVLIGWILLSGAQAEVRGGWAVDPSVRGQVVAGASGPAGQLAVRYHVLDDFAVEALGRSGYAFADADDVLFVGLLAGFAYAPAADAADWAPRVGARLAHIHHATVESWGDQPFANLAGDSSSTVQHRSGLEIAVGASAPRWLPVGAWATGLDLELTGGWLPSSDVMEWNVSLGVGLSFFSLGG